MPFIFYAVFCDNYVKSTSTQQLLYTMYFFNCYRLEKMLKGEMFSATELSEIGTFMNLTLKETNTEVRVCNLP